MACQLGGGSPVGYCALHKSTVTKKQMERRRCLQKQCRAFKKNNSHPYWVQKEKASLRRKECKLSKRLSEKGLYLKKNDAGRYEVTSGSEEVHEFDSIDEAREWFAKTYCI